MDDYKPLFQEEALRTETYRKLIIRQAIQTIRKFPHLSEEELVEKIHRSTLKACDLCVESSLDENAGDLAGKFFTGSKEDPRKDHVGRFFMHYLKKHLRKEHLKDYFIPVFAESVKFLLSQSEFEQLSIKTYGLVDQFCKKGLTYKETLASTEGISVSQEIVDAYKRELKHSPLFVRSLRNKLDNELVACISVSRSRVNIEEIIGQALAEFLSLLECNKSNLE